MGQDPAAHRAVPGPQLDSVLVGNGEHDEIDKTLSSKERNLKACVILVLLDGDPALC